jgi:hypothetical protein
LPVYRINIRGWLLAIFYCKSCSSIFKHEVYIYINYYPEISLSIALIQLF